MQVNFDAETPRRIVRTRSNCLLSANVVSSPSNGCSALSRQSVNSNSGRPSSRSQQGSFSIRSPGSVEVGGSASHVARGLIKLDNDIEYGMHIVPHGNTVSRMPSRSSSTSSNNLVNHSTPPVTRSDSRGAVHYRTSKGLDDISVGGNSAGRRSLARSPGVVEPRGRSARTELWEEQLGLCNISVVDSDVLDDDDDDDDDDDRAENDDDEDLDLVFNHSSTGVQRRSPDRSPPVTRDPRRRPNRMNAFGEPSRITYASDPKNHSPMFSRSSSNASSTSSEDAFAPKKKKPVAEPKSKNSDSDDIPSLVDECSSPVQPLEQSGFGTRKLVVASTGTVKSDISDWVDDERAQNQKARENMDEDDEGSISTFTPKSRGKTKKSSANEPGTPSKASSGVSRVREDRGTKKRHHHHHSTRSNRSKTTSRRDLSDEDEEDSIVNPTPSKSRHREGGRSTVKASRKRPSKEVRPSSGGSSASSSELSDPKATRSRRHNTSTKSKSKRSNGHSRSRSHAKKSRQSRSTRRDSDDSSVASSHSAGSNSEEKPSPTRQVMKEEPSKSLEESVVADEPATGQKTWRVKFAEKGARIGRGSFGNVYRGTDVATGRTVAIKEIVIPVDFNKDAEKQLNFMEREVRVMRRLQHPHTIRYLGVHREYNTLQIYMEFITGGTIRERLRDKMFFSDALTRFYTAQLLRGLEYLHSSKIVHRDLKGDNLFLTGGLSTAEGDDEAGNWVSASIRDAYDGLVRTEDANLAPYAIVKVGDFGTSKELITTLNTDSVAGTPNFMAPEVISCTGHSYPADIWSLGCCVLEMLTGRPPFSYMDNHMTVMYAVMRGRFMDQVPPPGAWGGDYMPKDSIIASRRRPAPSNEVVTGAPGSQKSSPTASIPRHPPITEGARDFMMRCTAMKPADRWTIQQLLEHPWLYREMGRPTPPSQTTAGAPATGTSSPNGPSKEEGGAGGGAPSNMSNTNTAPAKPSGKAAGEAREEDIPAPPAAAARAEGGQSSSVPKAEPEKDEALEHPTVQDVDSSRAVEANELEAKVVEDPWQSMEGEEGRDEMYYNEEEGYEGYYEEYEEDGGEEGMEAAYDDPTTWSIVNTKEEGDDNLIHHESDDPPTPNEHGSALTPMDEAVNAIKGGSFRAQKASAAVSLETISVGAVEEENLGSSSSTQIPSLTPPLEDLVLPQVHQVLQSPEFRRYDGGGESSSSSGDMPISFTRQRLQIGSKAVPISLNTVDLTSPEVRCVSQSGFRFLSPSTASVLRPSHAIAGGCSGGVSPHSVPHPPMGSSSTSSLQAPGASMETRGSMCIVNKFGGEECEVLADTNRMYRGETDDLLEFSQGPSSQPLKKQNNRMNRPLSRRSAPGMSEADEVQYRTNGRRERGNSLRSNGGSQLSPIDVEPSRENAAKLPSVPANTIAQRSRVSGNIPPPISFSTPSSAPSSLMLTKSTRKRMKDSTNRELSAPVVAPKQTSNPVGPPSQKNEASRVNRAPIREMGKNKVSTVRS